MITSQICKTRADCNGYCFLIHQFNHLRNVFRGAFAFDDFATAYLAKLIYEVLFLCIFKKITKVFHCIISFLLYQQQFSIRQSFFEVRDAIRSFETAYAL